MNPAGSFRPRGRQPHSLKRKRSIRSRRNDRVVLLVAVVCSDPECGEDREIVVGDLDGVEAYACDCGHGFVVVAVAEAAEGKREALLVSLPEARPAPTRRAA